MESTYSIICEVVWDDMWLYRTTNIEYGVDNDIALNSQYHIGNAIANTVETKLQSYDFRSNK